MAKRGGRVTYLLGPFFVIPQLKEKNRGYRILKEPGITANVAKLDASKKIAK